LKSLQTTAAYFSREYNNQKINVINYSERSVAGFINAANAGISVMVATFQSFAGEKKVMNRRGVEANLFGHAKSYMEGIAAVRPVLIIDEPHRFTGSVVQEYLPRFDPLMTLRFGATFKGDYSNLIYTLDSLEAFRQRLVKGITVDTVGTGLSADHTLMLEDVTGRTGERVAHVRVGLPDGKSMKVELRAKDNLGDKAGLQHLDGHVVERVTAQELSFTNDFNLIKGEIAGYGMLAEDVQRLIVARTVENHFEREETLFKQGIKALTLFFIDSVGKYMPDAAAKAAGQPAVLRDLFEREYAAQLEQVLAKENLDEAYRAYLLRSQADVSRVHKGYFAKSHSEKGEEEAIRLILKDKEELLSFDTDLRFIFSMWALQEGWDNPNVFTLCKLAPSNSKISKLQQIGRGLRLAVNQQLERVPMHDAAFDSVNELVVVVPQSEGDFVEAIQSEIAANSVNKVGKQFDDVALVDFGVAPSTRVAQKVLDILTSSGLVALDDISGQASMLASREQFGAVREALLVQLGALPGMSASHTLRLAQFFDAFFGGYSRVKRKEAGNSQMLRPRAEQYEKFKTLWENLNRDAVVKFELHSDALIAKILEKIEQDFSLTALTLQVTRTEHVQDALEVRESSRGYTVRPHAIFGLAEFVRSLANATRLSLPTVLKVLSRMPPEKFALLAKNENRALTKLRDLMLNCVYDLIVNQIRYELREVRVKTALTDTTGALLASIPASLCGVENFAITNSTVREKSLYEQGYMPVDSKIEKDTVDETIRPEITVFAKLPKVHIPTPFGKYNPDFGYAVVQQGRTEAIYLVVETKGYDEESEIGRKEKLKISSARHFFNALKQQGIPVSYRTKLNQESLAGLIDGLQT
jgi:type III restriction enzyme